MPGTAHALALLRERPDIAFGIHLTLVRDRSEDMWRPLTAGPSLVDDDGLLPLHAPTAGLVARTADVVAEFRAQIGTAVAAGLAPTHLDFHALADGGRDDVLDATIGLAREFGLAVRVWLPDARARCRAAGLPVVDHPFLDSFSIDVAVKADRCAALLRGLPPGLSEWAVHPGSDPGADHDATVRRGDLAFLASDRARGIVEDEGITLIDYQPVRRCWRNCRTPGA